ncbi:uncharacterized protein N7483_006711 [Penicillium malachiteum]|uniref:uncharacterized protein n=1 Tax=Penicillium malachiteum TaxID=1324776 RepID=UPI0025493859|nr:uncharacterized protein N7483_006711 [Penicillium malachiteum]KAJ5725354.1 hypothetical protein N7483_006711 [Penicillium malachiteum]
MGGGIMDGGEVRQPAPGALVSPGKTRAPSAGEATFTTSLSTSTPTHPHRLPIQEYRVLHRDISSGASPIRDHQRIPSLPLLFTASLRPGTLGRRRPRGKGCQRPQPASFSFHTTFVSSSPRVESAFTLYTFI